MPGLPSFQQIFEEDLDRARRALDAMKSDQGLAISAKYVGPSSKNVDFLFLHAQLLQWKGDYAAAEPFWSRVLALEPHNHDATWLRATCLANMGKRDEALAALEAFCARYPDENATLGAYLALLLVEHGPAKAIAVLKAEHLRRKPPRRLERAVEVLRQKALSLYDVAELRQCDPENLLELDSSAEDHGYTLRAIYEAFEPIGCNCEFGFVQRKCGAEPLSLFRWTAISPENLTRLLACDMVDYERPEAYSLRGDPALEFHLYEGVFDTQSHTGVNQNDIPAEEFLRRLTRRQGFLKRKFLADAAEGRKIFLYKADAPLAEEQMAGIEGQLARLGIRHCMFVMPTGDPARAGTVQIVSPLRGIGYLSSVFPLTKYDEWNKIVVAAYDHFVRGRAAA